MNKNQTWRRVLSLLCAMVMLVGMMVVGTVVASAAEANVAKVGDTEYATLQAAINAAEAGDTVTLLANVSENVTVNKALTIDGAGFQYVGKLTVAGASESTDTVTFENVKFLADTSVGNNVIVDLQRYAEASFVGCDFTSNSTDTYFNSYKGVYVANDCTVSFEDCTASKLYYMVHVPQGSKALTVENCTLTDMVYGIGAFKCITVNVSDFTYKGMAAAINVKNSVDSTLTLENVNITTTMNGQYPVAMWKPDSGNASVQYNIVLKETENKANGVAMTPDNHEQWFARQDESNLFDITQKIEKRVAEVNGEKYSTLAKALEAAVDGDTVTLLADANEDVTISKSITLDGADFKYTGTMTVAAGKTITVKNVNFVNGGIAKSTKSTTGKYTVTNCTFDGANNTYAYAFSFNGANTVTIEDCSVKNYMYGFLYVKSGAIAVTVKNVSVENCPNYAVYFASGVNNASFEKLTVKNGRNGFVINNTANRTLTVKNCVMENVTNAVAYSKGTLSITCKLLGVNDFGGGAVSNYANLVLLDTDTTVTAPETATVGVATDLVANYRAVFAEGKWSVKEIDFVAEVNGQKFESLQAAINAATDGQTVKMLKDVAYTDADVIKTSNNLTTIIKVEGKSITLNMNEKKIYFVYENTTTTIYSVVHVGEGAGLTVTGNGTIDVLTHETSPKVAYMFLKYRAGGYLNIESGYFHMNNAEDSMLYTNADRVITVSGGTFVLDKAGTRVNGFPCIFNAGGQNERKIVVTGGSFNVDVNHQYWCFEVEIDKSLALAYDEETGLWTVVKAVAYVGEIEGPYIHNVGYATVEEAGVRAAQLGDGFSTLVVLQDTLKSANLFVGSYINVYFNVYKSSFSSALKYTAYVYDAKGNVVEIPSNLWESHADSPDVYKINFKKLAAKQMADEFTIKIVCKDERVSLQKNIVENFSVKSYVENGWGSFNGNQRKLLSAMLVYGSAAQDAFKHNTADKADDVTVKLDVTSVPEELKVDNSVALRSYYYGASLTLENTIYFNFKFFADSVGDAAYAVIEAGGKAIRVDAEDFTYETKQGGKKVVVVTFDASVANATELAKCTFYAADKTAIVSAQDNILSYCYRAIEGISATPGYNGSLGVDFYTALANYAYAVSKYSK